MRHGKDRKPNDCAGFKSPPGFISRRALPGIDWHTIFTATCKSCARMMRTSHSFILPAPGCHVCAPAPPAPPAPPAWPAPLHCTCMACLSCRLSSRLPASPSLPAACPCCLPIHLDGKSPPCPVAGHTRAGHVAGHNRGGIGLAACRLPTCRLFLPPTCQRLPSGMWNASQGIEIVMKYADTPLGRVLPGQGGRAAGPAQRRISAFFAP